MDGDDNIIYCDTCTVSCLLYMYIYRHHRKATRRMARDKSQITNHKRRKRMRGTVTVTLTLTLKPETGTEN